MPQFWVWLIRKEIVPNEKGRFEVQCFPLLDKAILFKHLAFFEPHQISKVNSQTQ